MMWETCGNWWGKVSTLPRQGHHQKLRVVSACKRARIANRALAATSAAAAEREEKKWTGDGGRQTDLSHTAAVRAVDASRVC